jgi:hypothetical protein
MDCEPRRLTSPILTPAEGAASSSRLLNLANCRRNDYCTWLIAAATTTAPVLLIGADMDAAGVAGADVDTKKRPRATWRSRLVDVH